MKNSNHEERFVMNVKWITSLSATLFLLSMPIMGARAHPHHVSAQSRAIAAVPQENLDLLVRKYAKTVRNADSVEDLAEYLPKARMKKFRSDFSDRQKSEWLRFRKHMPYLGKLVSQTVGKEKAVLIYETPDEFRGTSRKKQKRLAEITLIEERGQWKLLLEHFGPASEIMPSKSVARRKQH